MAQKKNARKQASARPAVKAAISRATRPVIGKSPVKETKTPVTRLTGTRGAKPVVTAAEFQRLVQEKAYDLFLRRGASHQNDLNDWFEAEKRLREEYRVR